MAVGDLFNKVHLTLTFFSNIHSLSAFYNYNYYELLHITFREDTDMGPLSSCSDCSVLKFFYSCLS